MLTSRPSGLLSPMVEKWPGQTDGVGATVPLWDTSGRCPSGLCVRWVVRDLEGMGDAERLSG